MRKRIKVLVSLSLVFILTGCSTKKNDVSITPTAAASPTAAPVVEKLELSKGEQASPATILERASAREFVEIKNGDSFDLDGDGKVEQIKCERANNKEDCVNYVLSIGDATYSFNLDNPTESLYMSHMTKYGEDLQVLIDDYGPSDDCNTNIFHYEGGEIYYLGNVGGLVENIKSLGDGMYETSERAQILQTWFHPRKFYITGTSDVFVKDDSENRIQRALVRMPNEMYPVGTRVKLKCGIALLQTQLSMSKEVKLQKDQYATLVASDDEEWLYLQSDDDKSGWIRLKDVGDFFDGLWYYD